MWPYRPAASGPRSAIARGVAPALALALLLGAWELYVDLGGANPLVLPAPHTVAVALVTHRHELAHNGLITLRELVLGILAGVFVACGLATAIHFSPWLRRALYPLLIATQAIPIVLIALVLVIWLGFGLGTEVVIVAVVSFFPVVITTLSALESTDPELVKLMVTFGASRRQIFRHVELPAALPGLFTGTKLAAVLSVTAVVFAEMSGANAGLGYLFSVSVNELQAPTAFAAVVLLTALAVLLFGLLGALQRRVAPWATDRRRR